MNREPLAIRFYFDPALYELARLVSYGGIREADLKEKAQGLVNTYGSIRMNQALLELTVTDEKTRIVSLNPPVRKVCWQLLGPPPEHEQYAAYWQHRGDPPAHHQPPAEPTKKAPAKKRSRKKVS